VRRGDIYGCQLTVEFIARLRGEVRFPTIDALVAQIHQDVAQAQQLLEQMAIG
jgi:riboflavin kinase/FMN adenylyltransferase